MKDTALVVFDWDGTLMDSTARIVSCMRQAARECSLQVPTEAAVRHIIGLSLPRAFEHLFADMPASAQGPLFECYRALYISGDATPSPFFAGVTELLADLRQCNIRLAVATGKARHGLQRIFTQHACEPWFDDSICADEAQGKPSPDMLLQLLDRNSARPGQTVMVGDTCHDLEMAQRAGVASIGILHGAHEAGMLKPFAPMALVASIAELRPLLGLPVGTDLA